MSSERIIAGIMYLIVASIVHLIAKRTKLPYTILLFATGILLIPLTNFPIFGFLNSFHLTPALLFYIILPILIFESGYNIKYQKLMQNSPAIRGLATIGLISSAVIITVLGSITFALFNITVPRTVLLLFGIIISATDPVAVLGIFKNLGLSKRLSLLFEGESLFNDGTAVALFLLMIEILQKDTIGIQNLGSSIYTFLIMIIGGIILGSCMGIIFAKIIKYIKNNEVVEITLTMVLAHLTFITADIISNNIAIGHFSIQISGVIATAYAAIIMGNYGKTKISPKVEEYMDKFRNFFAFIANSIIFILMGIIIKEVHIGINQLWLPIIISITIVTVARIISVYFTVGMINLSHIQKKIPIRRQHILARGSLRGALGLMLALLIPIDFTLPNRTLPYSIRDFVLTLVISCIVFSLLIKGLSIEKLIKRLGLNKLATLEIFEMYESHILIYHRLIEKIEKMSEDYHISKNDYDVLKEKYALKIDTTIGQMQTFLQQNADKDILIDKALRLHALGIEKQYLKEMFTYNEMDEYLYLYLLYKLDTQITRVEKNEPQIQPDHVGSFFERYNLINRFMNRYKYKAHSAQDKYIIYRTRYILSNKVIDGLLLLYKFDFGYSKHYIENIIQQYKAFAHTAEKQIEDLKSRNYNLICHTNSKLLNKGLMKTEEKLIKELVEKEIITPKLYGQFIHEVEKEILQKV